MGDTAELARGYTLANDTQFRAGTFLLGRLGIAPGLAVLDVGCGPGNLTAHIASLVGPTGRVVGIDPSAERLAIARETVVPAHANLNITFRQAIAEDLGREFPDDDGCFDVVFVNSTLHWVQDQRAAMRQFARVLRRGGRLGVSGGSGDFVAAHETIKAAVLARPPYAGYPEERPPKFLTRRELEALLEDAGFHEREIVVNRIVKEAADAAEMIDWLDTSSSGKTYGGIPLELRPSARDEMEREWNKLATTDGGICMEMELLVTVAVKS